MAEARTRLAGAAVDSSAAPPSLTLVEWLAAILVTLLAAASWAALLTAEIGMLTVSVSVAVGLAGVAAIAVACYRAGALPSLRMAPADLALVGVLLALVGLGVWRLFPAASPWATFLDGGWYLNGGARIARERRLVFEPEVLRPAAAATATAPAVALAPAAGAIDSAASPLVSTLADGREAGLPFPADDDRGFHDVAFAVPDAGKPAVVPYHPPFFASWVAIWCRLSGIDGMGAAGNAVLPWALAYLLATGALATAAFGPLAGALALALMVAGPAFAYYGAVPYAEMAGGSLAVTGLWLLVRLERGASKPALAACAGLALGLAVLVKPELALVLGVAWLWWLLRRRTRGGAREGLAFLLGSAPPLAHAAVLAATVSRFYVALNGGGVLAMARGRPWALALGGLLLALVAVVAMAAPADQPPVDRWARRLRRGLSIGLLVVVAADLVLGYLFSSAARPSMLTTLAWLVTPLGLWAAVTAVVLLLEEERPGGSLLVGVALVLGPLLVVAPAVTQTLSPLYAARRLVPAVLPVLAALTAWTAVRAARARPVRWMRLVAAAGVALVIIGLVAAARPLAGWREFSGSAYIAERVASHTGARDVLLFPSTLDGSDTGRMAAAVWNLTDRASAVLASPSVDVAALDRAISAWLASGRRVFWVAEAPEEFPEGTGYDLELVAEESLVTRVLSPSPELPVRSATRELRLNVYEVVPAASP